MTLQLATAKVRKSGAWVPAVGGSSAHWTRPAGWLPLPTIAPGDQKFAGLFQVTNDDGNYIAFKASGDYTVDWGDGNAEDVASGVNAEHLYTYADVGGEITVSGITYRQAIVVVTPQAGHDLTDLNLQQAHSGLGANVPTNTAWLDGYVSSPNLATMTVTNKSSGDAGLQTSFGQMQQFRIGENVIVDMSYMFAMAGTYGQCTQLQSFVGGDFPACTDLTYGWEYCPALKVWTAGDFPACTSLYGAWYSCYALQSWAGGDFPVAADLSYAWNLCYALQSWAGGNFPACTTLSNAWANCEIMQSWVGGNFQVCTDLTRAWYYCNALQIWTGGDFPSATDISTAWAYCESMQVWDGGDFSAVATAATPWVYDTALRSMSGPSGMTVSVDLTGCRLGRAALVAIFNSLGTAVAQTITITGNYGSASLSAGDLLIATAKGWTVTQ